MNTVLGSVTKTIILKSENCLSQEFVVQKTKATLVLSGAAVASDTMTVIVDGKSTGVISWVDTAANFYAAVLAAIVALPSVASATWTVGTLTFTIIPVNQVNPAVYGALTLGSGAVTLTVATVDNTIEKGQLVKLDTDGTIIPIASGDSFVDCIGYSEQRGIGGDVVTVVVPGSAIVWGLSAIASLVPGKVAYAGKDATTGKMTFTSTTVTANTNFIGHAIDTGDAGDDIRVIIGC